jgi:hypothetical protein
MQTVGSADFEGGGYGTVYRALDPRECFDCGGEMGKGALFTRKRQLVNDLLTVTDHCRQCRPFAQR